MVYVFSEPTQKKEGRKLRAPWIGPFEVLEQVTPVVYRLRNKKDGREVRAHANRLARMTAEGRDVMETGDPKEGLYPDTRRALRSLIGFDVERQQYKVRKQGRRGYIWMDKKDIPDIVNKAFELGEGSGRQGLVERQEVM